MSFEDEHGITTKKQYVAKKMPSIASQIRQAKKQKRIEKLVRNAPEGSALRPWNYDKRKYI